MIYETNTGITIRVPGPEDDQKEFLYATGDAFIEYDKACKRIIRLLENSTIDYDAEELAEKIIQEILNMAPENVAFLSAHYDTFFSNIDISEMQPEPAVQ